MGKRIKYMGMSHVHLLEKGDDFGGRLDEPLAATVTFDRSNNWIVDADEAGLSSAALDILLLDRDFKDVSGMERIPLNKHQTTFLGMKDGDKVETPGVDAEEEELQFAAPEGDPAASDPPADAGVGNETGTTTTGGSTATTGRPRRGGSGG